MLLQTNSYVVPRDRKAEHARLVRRFRQTFVRLGCDTFEVYEQVGSNWSAGESSGRFVQIMRFRDRRHQLAVQEAERNDPDAQTLIAEFCELINFPYQRQQGLFAVGFYISVLPSAARQKPELADKTGDVEGDDEIGSASEKSSSAPAKPAALVEPGAATRSPIVTPVSPGQVPIITPVPGEAEQANRAYTEPLQGDAAVPLATATEDEPTLGLGELDDVTDFDESSETEKGDVSLSSSAEKSAAAAAESGPGKSIAQAASDPPASLRWQTTDDLDEQIEGDVTGDLSDTDENGQVRVADPELLHAEAEFAEYTSGQPVAAFDELKTSPPVIEGTLLDEGYEPEPIPLSEDDVLEALQLPMSEGESENGSADFEKEMKALADERPGELDELAPLADPASDDGKIKPQKHDEVAG